MTEEQKQDKLEEEIQLALDKVDVIIRHKENVKEACERLGKKFIKKGQIEFGIRLIAAGYPHDNTKFFGIEWSGLMQKDKNLLKEAISTHQLNNSHHPQFWGKIEDMPRIALAELVCDLYARAIEFGSDLRNFINNVYAKKHKIKPKSKLNRTIKEFVDLLLEEPFKEIK